MIILHYNIGNFFEELLADLECQKDTRAYIISTFEKYKTAEQHDLSQCTIGTLFCQARQKHDFAEYQKLGDWLLLTSTLAPQHLKNASKDYYDSIAQLSYYSCYNLLNRSWPCFEEIADRFIDLEEEISKRVPKLQSPKCFNF